jgi:hypothetical protein
MRLLASILISAWLLLAPCARAADSMDKASPMEALRLAMTLGADDVAAVDDPKDWWHDTKVRSWSVQRPAEPGFLDTTHEFIVTYVVDGVPLLGWTVDTRSGEISRGELPGCKLATREWCRPAPAAD